VNTKESEVEEGVDMSPEFEAEGPILSKHAIIMGVITKVVDECRTEYISMSRW